jgi:uncharacterized protein YifE (UPF0438 family)
MRTVLRVCLAFVVVCSLGRAARADDVLLCGDEHVWMSPSTLTREDAAAFREAANLTPEQAAAAETLIDAARAKMASIRRKFHREYYAQHDRLDAKEITREEHASSYHALDTGTRESLRKTERELLDDLRALLQPEQEEGWEKFMRSRRRAMLAWSHVEPRLDVCLALRAIGVRPASDPELAAAVENYEREVDAALIECRKAMAAREEADQMRVMRASSEVGQRFERARWALAQAQCRGYRAIVSKLAPVAQADLLRVRLATGGARSNVGQHIGVTELLSLTSISPEQLAAMKRVIAECQADYLAAAEAILSRRDMATVNGKDYESAGLEAIDDETETLWAKSALKTVERLRGALTPAQLAAYDDATDLPEHPAYGPGTAVSPDDELRVPPLPKPGQ